MIQRLRNKFHDFEDSTTVGKVLNVIIISLVLAILAVCVDQANGGGGTYDVPTAGSGHKTMAGVEADQVAWSLARPGMFSGLAGALRRCPS